MALSIKENFLKCISGGEPEFVPRYWVGNDPYATLPPQSGSIPNSITGRKKSARGYNQDIWGVEYIGTEDTGGQELPIPGEFLIDDIRKWRDIIKAPDLSDINWEMVTKTDRESATVNLEEIAVLGGGAGGYFMPHMNLMGFTNGLMSYYEEPDEVKAMYQYFHDFYEVMIANIMKYQPIDVFTVSDDTARATNPFISPAMYQEFIKPFVTSNTKIARDRGMPIMMHDCGRCEDFIDDWIDFGVCAWNPAQVINDLEGIKKKYGNKMVIVGAWNTGGPVGWDTCTEELMRSEVQRVINTFGPGGGFIFWGSSYGPPTHEPLINRRKWMTSEYEARRFDPYK
jgi:hypothetical protein